MFGGAPWWSSPAGLPPNTFLPSGSVNLRTTGLAAPVGTVAIDSSGLLWAKYAAADTAWRCLSTDDLLDTVQPTSGVDATLSIPSGTEAFYVVGKPIASASSNINARWNGNAATQEDGLQFFPAGGFGTTTVIGGASTATAFFYAEVMCPPTGRKSLWAHGTFDYGGTTRGLRFGYSFWDTADPLTSFGLRLVANAWAPDAWFRAYRRVQP